MDNVVLLRNQTLYTTEIDNDLVMMDAEQGFYFSLNPTAKVIWEVLASPTSYQDMINTLQNRYQLDEERCKSDINPFLQEMLKYRLIEQISS